MIYREGKLILFIYRFCFGLNPQRLSNSEKEVLYILYSAVQQQELLTERAIFPRPARLEEKEGSVRA